MLAIVALLFAACEKDDDDNKTTATPEPTLYERLGGETMVEDPVNPGMMIEQGRLGLRSVVDSTIFVIAGDDRLQPYFATLLAEVGNNDLTGFQMLSKDLTDFFCVATGSENYEYSGMDMVSAHDPDQNNRMALKADNASYDAFIEDVVIGAQQNGVPNDIIVEVGELLETLRDPIVQR
jgi:hypothetical protein